MPPASISKRKYDGELPPLRQAPAIAPRVPFIETGAGDADDSDEDEPLYNESMEELPRHPAFDPGLQAIDERDRAAAHALLEVMRAYATYSPGLPHMLEWASKNLLNPEVKNPMIGITGPMGAGKSSDLNSILGSKGIAYAVAGGEACTSVVTIYTHKLAGQVSVFAAEVDLTTAAECTTLLSDLLDSYNLYNFKYDDEWDQGTKDDNSARATTAFYIFQSMFNDQAEFATEEAAMETLRVNYNSTWKTLPSRMATWTTQMFRSRGMADGVRTIRLCSNTESELLRQLRPLTASSRVFESPSLWPLVKVVRVGHTVSRALRYVDIVDIPGHDDSNVARASMTTAAICKCQEIWYVINIDRAVDSKDLEHMARTLGRRFPGKFIVVPSHTDLKLDVKLRDLMISRDQDVSAYAIHESDISDLTHQRTRLNRDKKRNGARTEELDFRIHKIDAAIKELHRKQKNVLLEARNAHVTKTLKLTVGKLVPKGYQLPVFCVSNAMYEEVSQSDFSASTGLETARLSGIPALRAHALLVAAPELWRRASDFHCNRVSIFYQTAKVWVDNQPAEASAGLRASVKQLPLSWHTGISTSFATTIAFFDRNLMRPLHAGLPASIAAAHVYREKTIAPMVWQTLLANFRKSGTHGSSQVRGDSWNERLWQYQKEHFIIPIWTQLPLLNDGPFQDLLNEQYRKAMELPEQLISLGCGISLAPDALSGVIEGTMHSLQIKYDGHKEALQEAMGNIYMKATLDHGSAFFALEMVSCYEKGKNDSGPGIKARLVGNVTNHIDIHKAHEKALDRIRQAIRDAVKLFAADVLADGQAAMSTIIQTVTKLTTKKPETPGEAQARAVIGPIMNRERPNILGASGELRRIRAMYPELEVEDFTLRSRNLYTAGEM